MTQNDEEWWEAANNRIAELEAALAKFEKLFSSNNECEVCKGKGYVESVEHVTPCMTCFVHQTIPTVKELEAALEAKTAECERVTAIVTEHAEALQSEGFKSSSALLRRRLKDTRND